MKIIRLHKPPTIEIYLPDTSTEVKIPILIESIKAGFPSPADDYIEDTLDLNQYLIKNKSSTFFAKVKGNSMNHSNIFNEDILIIDKSIQPIIGSILVCSINGEFTIKRVKRVNSKKIVLMPDNPDFPPLEIDDKSTLDIWGVVTYSIHRHF